MTAALEARVLKLEEGLTLLLKNDEVHQGTLDRHSRELAEVRSDQSTLAERFSRFLEQSDSLRQLVGGVSAKLDASTMRFDIALETLHTHAGVLKDILTELRKPRHRPVAAAVKAKTKKRAAL